MGLFDLQARIHRIDASQILGIRMGRGLVLPERFTAMTEDHLRIRTLRRTLAR